MKEAKKEFTFAILTYKQENFILDQLESIKYQIENYGQDYEVSLVLSDDCSPDNTVGVAKKWLECYKRLFANIKVLAQEKNQGITKNFVTMMKAVETDQFKCLGGDDLYYKNNIFEMNEGADVVISATAKFHDCEILPFEKSYNQRKMLLATNLKEYLSNYIKYANCIETPGASYRHELMTEAVYKSLAAYSWLEDMPMWNNFFNQKGVTARATEKIYIIYRYDVGISNNRDNVVHTGFKADDDKVQKEIHTKRNSLSNVFFKLKNSLAKKAIKYWYNEHNPRLKAFNQNCKAVEAEGSAYLEEIMGRVAEFKKENGL